MLDKAADSVIDMVDGFNEMGRQHRINVVKMIIVIMLSWFGIFILMWILD